MLIDQAARMMEAARDWRYTRRVRKDLKFRAPIATTGASFVNSTNSLAKAGTFAGYTFVPGDYVTLTLNGTEVGDHFVQSRTDDDQIVLDADDITTDYAGTVTFDLNTARVALPSDVGRIVSASGNINDYGAPMSFVHMGDLEAESITTTALTVYYALEYVSATTFSAPTPTLRIWPEKQAARVNAMSVVYHRAWPSVTSLEAVLPIPPYMEPLLVQYAKALSRSFDESGDDGLAVAQVQAGSVFRLAAREDARNAPQSQGVRNTAVQPASRMTTPLDRPAYTYYPTEGF